MTRSFTIAAAGLTALGAIAVLATSVSSRAPAPPPVLSVHHIDLDSEPRAIRAGDLGGGSAEDLVVLTESSHARKYNLLSVFTDVDSTRPSIVYTRTLLMGLPMVDITLRLADIDRDSNLDLVISGGPWAVSMYRGNGDFRFAEPVWDGMAHSGNTLDATFVDINDDLLLDAVTYVEDWNGYIDYALGVGDGSFRTTRTLLANPFSYVTAILVADNNGDGFDEVFWGNEHGIYRVRGTADAFFGTGSETHDTETLTDVPVRDFRVIDLDHDDKLDLVYTVPLEDRIGVKLGNGFFWFFQEASFPTEPQPELMEVADIDGDGHRDVITGHAVGRRLTILYGAGDGTFPRSTTARVGVRPFGLAVGDFDGDGDPDIAAGATEENRIAIVMNNH